MLSVRFHLLILILISQIGFYADSFDHFVGFSYLQGGGQRVGATPGNLLDSFHPLHLSSLSSHSHRTLRPLSSFATSSKKLIERSLSLVMRRSETAIRLSFLLICNVYVHIHELYLTNHHSSQAHAAYGASCLLLAFLNLTTCHL